MRIVLDLQGAQTESRFRGIGRYSLSLAQGIVRNKGEHEVIILLNGQLQDSIEPIRAAFEDLLPQENIVVWYGPSSVAECITGTSWRRQAAQHLREAFIKSLNPDLVHISTLFEGAYDDCVCSIGGISREIPTVVTLYDLIPFINSNIYLDPYPVYKEYYLNRIETLKKAQGWLAISESSMKEAIEVLSLSNSSIFNISTAADERLAEVKLSDFEKNLLLEKYSIQKEFVLYTGGADSRKNLDRLIEAYALLPNSIREHHQLVLAGKMPAENIASLKAHAKSYGLFESDLVFTGYITDAELASLYGCCKTFIFPSWHEGFGLPALEAMCCGAPVIGSNTSSIPEVIGLEEALFDPLDAKQIKAKLYEALSDGEFRARLRAHGVEQIKKFSWDQSAKLALAALKRFLVQMPKVNHFLLIRKI
ncbi:glycosyltransferase family 4 protein [Pseudomonas asuensis]